MQRISDAKLCLSEAQKMLVEIEEIYNKNVYKEQLPPVLKIKIKNFLENVRSSLEYATNYIFYTYCASNYTNKKLAEISRKIYFPIYDDKSHFDKCINNKFKGLSTNNEILELFEKCQPFSGEKWSRYLGDLCNKNKHVKLTKHNRTESGTIMYFEDIFGVKIKNCTFSGCKHGMVYNGVPLNNNNINYNPYIKSFIGNINTEYIFEDTNTPVLGTLNEIMNGSKYFINSIEKIF